MEIRNHSLKEVFDKKNTACLSFHVYEVQDGYLNENDALHRSDYFQVVLLESGEAKQQVEENIHVLTANTVSVVFPNQVNLLDVNNKSRGIVIQFDEVLFCSDLLKNELSAYSNDLIGKLNYITLPTHKYMQVYAYATQILKAFRNLSPIKKEQIRFFIKIMLLEIIEAAHPRENSFQVPDQADQYARYKSLIEVDFKTERTVTYYAEKLRTTTGKLNEICKIRAGKTALQVIHERLLTEIKRLLLFSGMSCKEISFELGFDSPSALNKFVIAKTNATPGELKQQLSRIYNY
ncbi:AraC family transcriptional activator of pobA [Filimonas zeae]|uniref:HTH araC/xylS-type domain-containing protein n=1 Tax=Filimonas zeae TaxID=1737353 RepID=A0A917IP12_9BACT|nr:helix-turn-helix transcriptional regulator [Filimonas zeae]MDR6337737.1 AraC family transcriptional activator of pobA [Filimonas zeae]GGH60025.1 hypothetical protein GCM10011379_07440 [Filimonas zeae]